MERICLIDEMSRFSDENKGVSCVQGQQLL